MKAAARGCSSPASSKDKSRRGETLQNVLANACDALEVAKELAPLVPVPFLSTLFASAKVIVDASAQIQQNKLGCAELAERVASIVKEVRKEIRGKEDLVDESLKASLQQLNADFGEIRDFMLKESTRSTWSRILRREEISTRIDELSIKVNDSMQTFLSTSSIRLEVKLEKVSRDVSNIDNRLAVMDIRSRSERKWDGQYRIYRLGELHEGRLISSEKRMLYTSTEMTDGDVIEEELVSASIKGRVVAVKKFSGPSHVFDSTLVALKRIRHENIAQLEGYSDEDSDVRFLVFKGQLRRFGDYLLTRDSIEDRYNLYIRGVISMLSGHYHLLSQKLRWLGQLEDLMIDECSDAVLLGAQDDFISQHSAVMSGGDSTEASLTSPLVQLMDNLPSLIRDWDRMRDLVTYLPNAYCPVLIEPAISQNSARQQYESSVAYLPYNFWLTAEERALLAVRNVLIERIKLDGYWYSTTRRCPRRIGAVGSVVVFDSGLSYDETEHDYTTIDYMPLYDDPVVFYGGLEGTDSTTLKPEGGRPSECEIRMEIDELEAWSFLVTRGPALARERGVGLSNLGLQTKDINTAMAQFRWTSESSSSSEEMEAVSAPCGEQRINFHIRYDAESGFYEEPWGYFSFDDNPSPSCIHMEPEEGAWSNFVNADREDDDEYEEDINFEDEFDGVDYRSTLDDIDGVTKQRSYAEYIMLHEDQAEMLEWAHSLSFSPTGTRIEYRHRSIYA